MLRDGAKQATCVAPSRKASIPHAFNYRVTGLVLVTDANAAPVGFHDILVEDLLNTPVYHVQPVTAQDLTSLRHCWLPSLFADMYRRQADKETLRRGCKREFDSEFGGGRGGRHLLACCDLAVSFLFRFPSTICQTPPPPPRSDYDRTTGLCTLPI